MGIGTLAPPPLRSRLVDKDGLMSREFNNWLRGLTSAIETAPTLTIPPQVVSRQSAALGTTVLVSAAPGGTYRLSYGVRITQAATTSSSVTVTLSWIAGSRIQSFTGAAVTGNTLTTTGGGSVLATIDAGTILAYHTDYASVGAQAMEYELTVVAEGIGL